MQTEYFKGILDTKHRAESKSNAKAINRPGTRSIQLAEPVSSFKVVKSQGVQLRDYPSMYIPEVQNVQKYLRKAVKQAPPPEAGAIVLEYSRNWPALPKPKLASRKNSEHFVLYII
jgi:hypothetical protein